MARAERIEINENLLKEVAAHPHNLNLIHQVGAQAALEANKRMNTGFLHKLWNSINLRRLMLVALGGLGTYAAMGGSFSALNGTGDALQTFGNTALGKAKKLWELIPGTNEAKVAGAAIAGMGGLLSLWGAGRIGLEGGQGTRNRFRHADATLKEHVAALGTGGVTVIKSGGGAAPGALAVAH